MMKLYNHIRLDSGLVRQQSVGGSPAEQPRWGGHVPSLNSRYGRRSFQEDARGTQTSAAEDFRRPYPDIETEIIVRRRAPRLGKDDLFRLALFLLDIASYFQQFIEHFSTLGAARCELGICLLVSLFYAV